MRDSRSTNLDSRTCPCAISYSEEHHFYCETSWASYKASHYADEDEDEDEMLDEILARKQGN